MAESQKDILVLMSDQHTPYYSGFDGYHNVDTPNLNRMSERGVTFDECYTVSPLCGPARMAFLSTQRPAATGIFHTSTLPDTTPTFLHSLVERGYETVLVGRMHFIGLDQYHGFTRHIAADMTPVTWNYLFSRDELRRERGVYALTDTFSGKGAASIAGGGTSPVLEYDRFVTKEALRYLEEEHDKPQFIMVSVYGPHFPYVAPKDLYEKYRANVMLPVTLNEPVSHPFLASHQTEVTDDMVLACQAAYCGMIEHVDTLFGKVMEAFEQFTEKRGTRSAVFYLSDHGDQCGDRRIFGKQTFYEKSVKIPFIACGDGIDRGRRIEDPVSIMDIGPTILDYTGASPMYTSDGVSVLPALRGEKMATHPVYSEYMERLDGKHIFGPYDPSIPFSHGFMLREGTKKLITYQNYESYDCLYDVKEDPEERHNKALEKPDELKALREEAGKLAKHDLAMNNFRREDRTNDLMQKYERASGRVDLSLRWNGASLEAGRYPEICVKNPAFFPNDDKKK